MPWKNIGCHCKLMISWQMAMLLSDISIMYQDQIKQLVVCMQSIPGIVNIVHKLCQRQHIYFSAVRLQK